MTADRDRRTLCLAIDRRGFLSLLAAAPGLRPLRSGVSRLQSPGSGRPRGATKTALQASVGSLLAHYDVDADGAALTRRGAMTLGWGLEAGLGTGCGNCFIQLARPPTNAVWNGLNQACSLFKMHR